MVIFERIKTRVESDSSLENIQETCQLDKPWGHDVDLADYLKLDPLGLRDFLLTGLIRHQFYDTLLNSNNFVPKERINAERFCQRVGTLEDIALRGVHCPGAREILRKEIMNYDYVGTEYDTACIASGMMIKRSKGCLKVESPNDIKSSVEEKPVVEEKLRVRNPKNTSLPEENSGIGRGQINFKSSRTSAQ